MSYDISINDPVTNQVLSGDVHFMRGGVYHRSGTNQLWTSETYNYHEHFVKALGTEGIYTINGLQAVNAIPLLQAGILVLGDDVDNDYWKSTEGNAKRALYRILALCKMRPDGIVEVN